MSVNDEIAKFKLTDIPGQGLGLTIPSTIYKADVKFRLKRNDEFETCRVAKEQEIKFAVKSNGAYMIKIPDGIDYDETNKITIKGANINDNTNDYGIALKNYGSSDAGFDSTIDGTNESEEDTFTLKADKQNLVLDEMLGRTDGGNKIDYHTYLKTGDTANWDNRKPPVIKEAGQEIRFFDADGSDINAKLTFEKKDIHIPKKHSVKKVTIQKKGNGEITRTASDSENNDFTLTVNSNQKTFYPISYSGNHKKHKLDSDSKTWGQIYWSSSCPSDNGKDGQLFITAIENVELIDADTPTTPPPDTPTEPDPTPSPPPPTTVYTGPTDCPPGPWSPPYDPSAGCTPAPSTDDGGDKDLIFTKTGDHTAELDLKHYAGKLVTLRIQWSRDANWENNFSFTVPSCSDITGSNNQTPLYSSTTISKSNPAGPLDWRVYNIDGGTKITFTSTSVPGTQPTRQHFKLNVTSSTSVAEDGTVTTTYTRSCINDYVESANPWPPCDEELYITKTGYTQVTYVYSDGAPDGANDQYITVTLLATRDVLKPNKEVSFDEGLQRHIWVNATSPDDSNGEPGHSLSDYHTYTPLTRIRNPINNTSKTDLPTDGTGCEELYNHAGAMEPARIDSLIAAGITDLSSI